MTDVPETDSTQQAMPAPVRRGPKWVAIALALVLIVGVGAFAAWWFLLRAPSPADVVQRFIDSTEARDYDGMISCFTRKSVNTVIKDLGGKQAVMRTMKESKDEYPQSSVLGTTYHNGGKTALVKMEAKPKAGSAAGVESTDFVMVREGGQWKIDLKATIDLAFAEAFSAGFGGGGSGG